MINCRQLLLRVAVCSALLAGVADVNSQNADKINRVKLYEKLLAIETGYAKRPIQFGVKTDDLSKDLLEQYIAEDTESLRCFFKLVGLSFMEITRYLLKLHAHDRVGMTIDTIESLEPDALAMITAYGNLQLAGEYDLWMFYMYTAKIRSFCDYYRQNDGRGDKQILFNLSDIHENVAKQLKANTAECVPNRFQVTGSGSELFDRFKTVRFTVDNYRETMELLHDYRQQLAQVMDKNLTLAAFTENSGSYKLDRLFLTNLVMGKDNLDNLMNLYDPYINWGDTKRTVRDAYRDVVGTPMVMYDGMKDLRKYHALVKDMLTVILLRMVWTHVELMGEKFEKKHNRLENFFIKSNVDKSNKPIVKIINEFVRVVNLGDSVLHDVIECLVADSWNCIAEKGKSKIKNLLVGLSLNLQGLDATSEHVVGDEQAFSSKVVQLMKFAESIGVSTEYKKKKVTPKSALEYNFIRAKIFVNHLEKLGASANYELIHTILNSVIFIPYDDINVEQFFKDQTKGKQ